MIFKVQSQGDTVYVRADDARDVPKKMSKHFGLIPGSAYDAVAIEEDDVPQHEEILE